MTSTAFKQAVFSARTTEAFPVLLTISHSSFTDDIRVSSDPAVLLPEAGERGIVSRGLEYVFFPFEITLPQQDETGIARARISIDNIDRRVVRAIRAANSAVSVKIEVVASSDVDTPEFTADNFRLEQVEYDAFTVSGDISVEYFDLEPYPAKRYTPSDFPGLF